MRTNIVIDDQLMSDALKATGLSTKKEAVEDRYKMFGHTMVIKCADKCDIETAYGESARS